MPPGSEPLLTALTTQDYPSMLPAVILGVTALVLLLQEMLALLVCASLAAAVVCGAAELLMAYLSIEFLSITSYILVSYLKFQRRSTEAGLKYFLFGAIAGAVMLYGISLLSGLTGTTALY